MGQGGGGSNCGLWNAYSGINSLLEVNLGRFLSTNGLRCKHTEV